MKARAIWWAKAAFSNVMAVGLLYLFVSGCSYVARTIPALWTPAPVPALTLPPPAPCPTPPPVRPAEAPAPPPAIAIAKVDNGDRVKRITAARGDLKTGLTALELRAVTACTEPGEACVANQGLMERARALDKSLAAALLDPKAPVDWAEVTTVLRAVVDSAMKGAPK